MAGNHSVAQMTQREPKRCELLKPMGTSLKPVEFKETNCKQKRGEVRKRFALARVASEICRNCRFRATTGKPLVCPHLGVRSLPGFTVNVLLFLEQLTLY